MFSYYIMSFSIYCNSINGTQVAGAQSQIQYNFDFRNTPEHNGGYKVYMTFASETQAYPNTPWAFGRVNIDLGVFDSYTPMSAVTGTRQNTIFGFIRPSIPMVASVSTYPVVVSTGTASIPVNSGTAAYTLTTTTTTPTYSITNTGVQTIDAMYSDNPPLYIQSKPTNNQFIVKLTYHDGALYTALTAHYGMLLTFEAI